MFKTTADLRNAMNTLYDEVIAGKTSNATARAKVAIARAILDTLKVEITACSLGKQFSAVHFDEINNGVPDVERLRRVS